MSVACARIPNQRYALDRIDFIGTDKIDDSDLRDHIASHETPKFAGLFAGVLEDYEVFDRYVLERDLERIQRYYRARGYYRARARVARVFPSGKQHVRVEIVVDEGPPVLVRRVDVHGLEHLSPEIVRRAQRLAQREIRLGEPFDEERMQELEKRLAHLLGAHGYAFAEVKSGADVDLPQSVAAVGFWVDPGPLARLGPIRIEGLGKIPEGPVARALDLKPGAPYSIDRIEEARQAVLELGVFSAVTVEPDLPPNSAKPEVVPLRVKVEVSKLRSIRLGGGVELDSLKSDIHLTAGWENRNFFGGFRSFLIEAVPGVVLYPTHLPDLKAPRHLLPQGRLRAEFRQPGFIEARTTGLLRAQASIYPLILSNDLPADAPVIGYSELRGSAGVERSYGRLSASLSHTVQWNSPFTYLGPLDPDLVPVLVSYPELFLDLELTDKRVRPHKGVSLRGTVQVAGVGGDARDVKLNPDVRGYIPLGKKLTLATRANIGFLFPANYGSTVEPNAFTKSPGDVSRQDWVRDSQLMFLRGFFAGGPASNRGYAEREIGPHGIVPFYAPGATATTLNADCRTTDPTVPSACDLPLGGFTLWEASVELRYPIAGALSGAVFTDAADVAPETAHFRFNRPHLSAGAGFRYDTPVGPIRLDVGYRIPHLQAPPSSPDEGEPTTIFGAPIAFSFGIGEAF
ncbi:MAG TPA: BamA/TamA family outer membrane protein [Polyangiaceae bacterium]|nr:BamA/TamA family outer membrane protein [Polyangiaceae bacterium]